MNTASKFTPTNVVFGSVLLSSAALLGCGGADGASELDAAPDPSTWAEEDSPKWSGEAPEPAGTPPEGLADEALEPTLVDEPVIDKMHNGTRVRGRGAIQVSIYQDVTDPSSKGLCSGGILNDKHIITAAHCVKTPGWKKTEIWYDKPDVVWKWSNKYVRYYIHPNYRVGSSGYDVAVGYLLEEFHLDRVNQLDNLTLSRKKLTIGKKLTATGYGTDYYEPTDHLQRRMQAYVTFAGTHDVNWATSSANPTAKLCGGDSGGPDLLYAGYQDDWGPYWETMAATNTAVWDDGWGHCGATGRMTQTYDKVDWIEAVIETNSNYTCLDFTTTTGVPASWCWALQ